MSRTQPIPADETVPIPVDRRATGPARGPGSAKRRSSKRRSPSARRRSRRRTIWSVTILVVLIAVSGTVWAWWNGSIGSVALREHCTATANGSTTQLDPDQAGNAAIIVSAAVQRGLRARAASIGIATAIQESKLRNITYGDRDSIGLFQQRPSQGWGTRGEIMDPVYSSNAFYDELEKVEGYEGMEITDVAQEVQRSAFPEAYADHEPEGRIIASALSGYSPGGLNCVLKDPGLAAETPTGDSGLTPRADAVRAAAEEETGQSSVQAAGESGAALRFRVAPHAAQGSDASKEQETTRSGWNLAQWAVARAAGLNIVRVQLGDQQWDRSASPEGWTTASDPLPNGTVVIEVA